MRRSHSGPGPDPGAPDWCHPRRGHVTAITSIPAAGSRTRSKRRRAIRSTRRSTSTPAPIVRRARGQALIWFNARHDGITLEAVGRRHPHRRQPRDRRSPRAQLSRRSSTTSSISATASRGRPCCAASRSPAPNNFTTGSGEKSPIESDDIRKTPFFYTDGGGIKIYARSYPTIEYVEVYGNYTSPCGGGVSVEHLGQVQDSRALPQLHLPRQPHPDHRLRLRPPARQPRRPSRTASSSATSPTWASTSSGCWAAASTTPSTAPAP